MEEETDNRTQTQHLEGILNRSDKCYEFFTGEYELNHEDFKYQLKQLVIMSYMQLMHFKDVFLDDAKDLDQEESLAVSNKKRIDNVPEVESADPALAGEDQPEPVTESADPAGAGEDLVTPLGVSSKGQEEVLSLSLSEGEDSFSDDTNTSVLSPEAKVPPDASVIEESDEMSDTDNVSYFLDKLFRERQDVPEMDFLERTLKAIKKVAPNLRYKPKHLRRKKFKVVPYEFSSVWRNVSSIFSDEEDSNHSYGSIMPQVTWEKVNVGGLKKLPTPKKFPILSASADPKFYLKNCDCDQTKQGILCSCRVCPVYQAQYSREFPHGSIHGFATNLGVVPVPDTPMFGHVWDDDSSSWLLHAEVAPDGIPASSTPSEGRRERTQPRRRSRGTSRGTPRWTRRGRVSG